jgi:hypothetical protein
MHSTVVFLAGCYCHKIALHSAWLMLQMRLVSGVVAHLRMILHDDCLVGGIDQGQI